MPSYLNSVKACAGFVRLQSNGFWLVFVRKIDEIEEKRKAARPKGFLSLFFRYHRMEKC
jgi:hypothetical protein